VVRLRVTNAAGASSVATETIDVVQRHVAADATISGRADRGHGDRLGVKLRVLRVQQLPAGARIAVRCKGRGCPIKFAAESRRRARRAWPRSNFPDSSAPCTSA